MSDVDSLVTADALAAYWAPPKYRIVQDLGLLQIRAYFGPGTATDRFLPAAGFFASGETRLYGELVFHSNPAIRHEGTLALNNVSAGEDLASFRTGPSPGTEVVRVTVDGWPDKKTTTTRTAYASIHASAFFRDLKGDDNSSSGLAGSSGAYETAHLETTEIGAFADFCADFPCRIPNGASITAIFMLYQVASGGLPITNKCVKVSLFKTALSDNTGTDIHVLTSGQGTGSMASAEDSVSAEVIDYDAYTYGVRVSLRNSYPNANTSLFYALRITYTYSAIGG